MKPSAYANHLAPQVSGLYVTTSPHSRVALPQGAGLAASIRQLSTGRTLNVHLTIGCFNKPLLYNHYDASQRPLLSSSRTNDDVSIRTSPTQKLSPSLLVSFETGFLVWRLSSLRQGCPRDWFRGRERQRPSRRRSHFSRRGSDWQPTPPWLHSKSDRQSD
jgi:hypothetical protein